MIKEKTVLQELFMQLKLQLGNNKVSQTFDEVYWLAKEQEQIEKALEHGWFRGKEHGIRFGTMIEGEDRRKDIAQYLQSKYGGQHD